MKFILLCLALLLCGAGPARAATPGEVVVGQPLRDVRMRGLLVPSRNLSEYRGKPLIINVWASWCGPCRQEMGSLQRLAAADGGRQFNLIGISTDDYQDRAEAFVQRLGLRFPNYIDQRLVLEHMLGAERLPLTVLVDGQGRVTAKFSGAFEWDQPEMKRAVARALRVKL